MLMDYFKHISVFDGQSPPPLFESLSPTKGIHYVAHASYRPLLRQAVYLTSALWVGAKIFTGVCTTSWLLGKYHSPIEAHATEEQTSIILLDW